MSANSRITVVDIQHRTFKRALQGYDRTDVDKFLDEIIESLEDEATARAAYEAEIADLKRWKSRCSRPCCSRSAPPMR
jgi:DivIVA domain-containing protein